MAGQRPRGYADWSPNEELLLLIDQVKEVLDEYRAQLPMTARQIFYRLVGAYGYDKTERAYKNLCEELVRARRARMVDFRHIRDDGTTALGGDFGYDSIEEFYDGLRSAGSRYRRAKREGQEYRVELWCEAAGMAPQLQRVASEFGVGVYSTGGFSSVTVTHEIADRVAMYEEPTVFLHVGDYDPSGESIFGSMTEDVEGFLGYRAPDLFVARRVALTEEQVAEHDLPTAPPKRTDTRSVNWDGETCQAEAMPPDLLASTVRDALEGWTDLDLVRQVQELADEERSEIEARLLEIDFLGEEE
jgi:hypothetical protein